MPDTKQLLERTARRAPSPGYHPETIRDRAERRRRSQRMRTSALALALSVLVGVGAFAVVRTPVGTDVATGVTGDGESLPPATVAPVEAGEGEYYYEAILMAAACGDHCTTDDVALDATTWWSPSDESGRIAVDAAQAYGIEAGRFGSGEFPNLNGVDVSGFPLDRAELLPFLLERSNPNGGSPAPVVTPPPNGAPFDGQLWRAITDLLPDPHTTPAVRAALLEVAAQLQGSTVTTDSEDPFGRPAHVIEFGNEGGSIIERLYVDPASHDLLTWTFTMAGESDPVRYYVVQDAGIASSTETGVEEGRASIPSTILSVDDIRAMPASGGDRAPAEMSTSGEDITERCSQGGPDLELTRSSSHEYDHDCFVVETGASFTITFTVDAAGASGRLRIFAPGRLEPLFDGEPVTGPGSIVYDIPALGSRDDAGANEYLVLDGELLVGTLYVR
jgi:hypothetical protein